MKLKIMFGLIIFFKIIGPNLWCDMNDNVLAEMPPSWVWPTNSTTKPVDKTLTIVNIYRYKEMSISPPVMIDPILKNEQRYGTPEEAMISRVSAMMALDYEWWLNTWDPASRILFQEKERASDRTKDYWIQWWKDSFRFTRFTLIRHIETGPYVILTYRMMSKDGKDVGRGLELPVVFRNEHGHWLVTADLSSDQLAQSSPWVSGKELEEILVR